MSSHSAMLLVLVLLGLCYSFPDHEIGSGGAYGKKTRTAVEKLNLYKGYVSIFQIAIEPVVVLNRLSFV